MRKIEDRHIDFVVRYYQEGKLDTQRAIKRFYDMTGIKHSCIGLRIWTVAASLALIVALSITLLYIREGKNDQTTLIATNTSLTSVLIDGSKVILAPHSVLSYDPKKLKEGNRIFSLEGKAYFHIHHDEHHPCFVETKLGNVKVLGTVFQVDNKEDETKVYVESGKVCFYNNEPSLGVILTKGMGGKLTRGSNIPLPYTPDNNMTSWVTGIFHFDHTPVSEALKQMSEYCQISLTTNAKEKYLSGDMEITNAEDAKDLVESTLGIKVNIKK